jgi:hypothetical protein
VAAVQAEAASSGVQAVVQPSDIKGHWAETQISSGVNRGLIKGYEDGTFKPENSITRAEFMAIVNRAFGYSEKAQISFSDVSANDWYAEEAAKAKAVGYITGYDDGTMKPNNQITRQEVAAIISRIMELEKVEDSNLLGRFSDAAQIAGWSKGYVGAVVKEGYMGGYPDGTCKPAKSITRAESIVMLDRVAGVLYNAAGTYGPEQGKETIEGNVTIASTDVTLRNTEIKGNLYLTEAIGDGEVALDNVAINGKTVIKGGGPNSIVVKDSELRITIVNTKTGKVRIVAKGSTKVGKIILNSGAKLEEEGLTEKGFGECVLSADIPEGEEVQFSGDFEQITVASPKINISILKGNVGKLEVAEQAKGAVISIAKEVTVSTLTLNAAVAVKGEGKIENAVIKAAGVTIEQKPVKVEVAEGISANVGGQEVGGTPAAGGGIVNDPVEPGSAEIISAAVKVGGITIAAEKVGENEFKATLPSNIKDEDKFTEFTINASKNAESLTVKSLIDGIPDKTVNFQNGKVDLKVSDLMGSLDKDGDGVSVGVIKFFTPLTVTGILVDTEGNETPVILQIE